MPEALVCPTCSAPLDYPANGGPSMRCPYCNASVLIPKSSNPTADIPEAFRPLIERAIAMAQASGRAPNKIELIRQYRAQTGMGLKEAKDAVELHLGQAPMGGGGTKPAGSGTKVGCVAALIVMGIVAGLMFFITRSIQHQIADSRPDWMPAPIPAPNITAPPTVPAPPAFANQVLAFGSEGISPGHFKDARSVAMDGQGHIYVGEFSDGRVQVFDTQGKLITQWSIGQGQYLTNLVADRAGTVYAVVGSHILRFTGITGSPLDEIDPMGVEKGISYSDACIGPDGEIYAIVGDVEGSDILILTLGSKIRTIIKASEKVGESVSFKRIAVIGTGEIFLLGGQNQIFKFAPDGRYINRFGGGAGPGGAGHLNSPQSMAIDSQGRIYVSDSNPAIKVFSPDGNYLDSFGGNDVVFGIAINDQDQIFGCFRNKYQIREFVQNKH